MIARNNIFNIRPLAKGQQWMGQAGAVKGFAEFETREYGIRAWLVLMRTYRQRHGCRTIRQIVTRFAPPTENNTAHYIGHCCGYMGIGPDTPLSARLDYCALAGAMARMETGTNLGTLQVLEVMDKYKICIA